MGSPKLLPNFLGIGSQRCGTTWLDAILRMHPQVIMPSSVKEVHYFDREIIYHDFNWYLRQFSISAKELPKESPFAIGELTPEYILLGDRQVRQIRRLLPELKILLVIRNPISRTWSLLKRFVDQDERYSVDHLVKHYVERRKWSYYNDYLRALSIWGSVFGPEAIHVELYDDLESQPDKFIARIFSHLGVDSSWVPSEERMKKKESVSSASVTPVPPYLAWHISSKWIDKTRKLNEQLDGRISHWVDEMEDNLREWSSYWKVRCLANGALMYGFWHPVYESYGYLKNRSIELGIKREVEKLK